MAKKDPRAKSALRKQLDARMNYQAKLAADPIEVPMKSFGEENPISLYYKPVGAIVKDLYIPDLIDNKMSGWHKLYFYRALGPDGRRLYNGQKDLQDIMNDPDSAPMLEFGAAVMEDEGLEVHVSENDVQDAEGN